jgi:hypothetical protein
MFLEEPCLPDNVDTMVRIARATTIPIAAGERLFTRWGFREYLEKQAVAIVQPDVCHAGGILETKKIAAMAEVYHASIAPHVMPQLRALFPFLGLQYVCYIIYILHESIRSTEDREGREGGARAGTARGAASALAACQRLSYRGTQTVCTAELPGVCFGQETCRVAFDVPA